VAGGAAGLCGAVIGVWSASIGARSLRAKDPQLVVVDEVAGMLVTMLPVAHPSWIALTAGFALFRLLDVVKPWPVHRFERLPGGLWMVAMLLPACSERGHGPASGGRGAEMTFVGFYVRISGNDANVVR
jgi:hypothetical protein